jgi:rhodanese-related sulfurtransferase
MMPQDYPLQIDVATLSAWREAGEPLTVIDVREAWEWDRVHLPASRLIPLGSLPTQVDALPRVGALILLCHHGARSLHATRFLREIGFGNAVNLSGGIDRWALEIDPSLPRY